MEVMIIRGAMIRKDRSIEAEIEGNASLLAISRIYRKLICVRVETVYRDNVLFKCRWDGWEGWGWPELKKKQLFNASPMSE